MKQYLFDVYFAGGVGVFERVSATSIKEALILAAAKRIQQGKHYDFSLIACAELEMCASLQPNVLIYNPE